MNATFRILTTIFVVYIAQEQIDGCNCIDGAMHAEVCRAALLPAMLSALAMIFVMAYWKRLSSAFYLLVSVLASVGIGLFVTSHFSLHGYYAQASPWVHQHIRYSYADHWIAAIVSAYCGWLVVTAVYSVLCLRNAPFRYEIRFGRRDGRDASNRVHQIADAMKVPKPAFFSYIRREHRGKMLAAITIVTALIFGVYFLIAIVHTDDDYDKYFDILFYSMIPLPIGALAAGGVIQLSRRFIANPRIRAVAMRMLSVMMFVAGASCARIALIKEFSMYLPNLSRAFGFALGFLLTMLFFYWFLRKPDAVEPLAPVKNAQPAPEGQ